eukprot:CAMPEP_0181523584 /NCGR_PEP_ID=MMETSP1110-20121109/67976_1 /TAXON_ID=174948 /ORGANISM="Symbiodinium sp., Strain CCMP421" /LENGTH=44 /DNA_ID= /DNA_START= /DNA_END= /DNA_ORIENTATION=
MLMARHRTLQECNGGAHPTNGAHMLYRLRALCEKVGEGPRGRGH